MRYCTLYIWAAVLFLSESCAIINDLDDFMLQIIYTTVFRIKRLNNLMFDCLTVLLGKPGYKYYLYNNSVVL